MALPHAVDAPITCPDWDEVVDSLEWQCYGWIIYPDGGEYHAKKGDTMVIAYSSANPEAVFQYVFNNCASGDSIFVKNGNYSFGDTATLATTAEKHRIHIIGESKGVRIRPPSGDWAFEIGDPTHTTNYCERLIIEGLRFYPTIPGDGSAIKLDYCYQPLIKDCDFYAVDTGIESSYSSISKFVRCRFQEFHTRGLYLSTSATGLIADQYIFQSYFESDEDGAIGLEVEYNVNGIMINDCFFAGDGLDPAIKITASYSGIWVNNTVIDGIGDAAHAYNGIELLGSGDDGVEDIQFSNTWIQSCGGYGLYMLGDATNTVYGGQFDNCIIANNRKAGIYMENVEYMYFDNCRIHVNGLEDAAADRDMAQVYINDEASHILFNNCGFVGSGGVANPQYVVILDADNSGNISVKFGDCYLSHPANQNSALIAYDRATVGETLYVYAHDTYSRTGAVGAGIVISQIGAQAANQEQNVDSKNGTDGWWL